MEHAGGLHDLLRRDPVGSRLQGYGLRRRRVERGTDRGVRTAKFWQWQFRGSVVALDVNDRENKVEDLHGAARITSGGSIWGSTGAVDPKNNQIFMATGNNFAVPQSVLDCLGMGPTPRTACTRTTTSIRSSRSISTPEKSNGASGACRMTPGTWLAVLSSPAS